MALTKIPANMLSGVDLGDSVRVNIGSDNDLALFHTGANGVIHNATGELRIRANTLKLQDYSNEDLMIVANSNGSVDLYHNNVKKLETSAAGISVTGSIATTSDITQTVTGSNYFRSIASASGNSGLFMRNTARDWYVLNNSVGTLEFFDGTASAIRAKIDTSGNATFNHDVTIVGNLNLTGDINTTSVTDLDVTDKTITVAKGSADAAAANGAGIVVDGASASLTYNNTGDGWVFNKSLGIGSASASYRLDVETSSSDIARFTRTGSSSYLWQISDIGTGAAQLWASAQTNDTGFLFRPKNSSGSNVNALLIAPDGQLLINKTGSDVGASTNIVEADGNFRLSGGNRSIKFNNGSHEVVGLAQIASQKIQYASGRMTIDYGNSRVGIGTATYGVSPTHPLHVHMDVSNDTIDETKGLVKFQSTGGNGMIFGTIASSPYTSYIQSGYVVDTSLAQYSLALNPLGGNVGIGTSTPQAILSVKKPLAQESADLRVLDLAIPGSWSLSGNAGHTADITWTNSISSGTIMGKFGLRYAGTATGGNSEFVFKDMYQGGYGASADIMYLGSNGYVSIPGRLGIGIDTPSEFLHVKGTNGSIAIDANGASNTASIKFINDNERSRITSNYGSGGGGQMGFWTDTTGGSLLQRMYITNAGHVLPGSDNAYDLGATSNRWRNVYTTDLHLSNEGSQNDVDGTSGNWTIQEGEEHLFIINNKNGKKYKFALEEIE